MRTWLVNGELGESLHCDDRGVAYGDGLFETIALRGGSPRFLERHLARLAASCRRLAFPEPPLADLVEDIRQLTSDQLRGTIKLIVTRGRGPRGYGSSSELRLTRAVGFSVEDEGSRRGAEGIRVISCKTLASSNPTLAGMKTLNRLDNVLARSECQEKYAQEGVMWDLEGHLVGGTMSNVFAVAGGRLLTPALRVAGVAGIMRGVVLEIADSIGVGAEETDIDAHALENAEELFFTNALIGLWPAIEFSSRTLEIGPVTRQIQIELSARGVEEDVG